ncbi:MAG: flagellar hook-associated protein 1 [Thermosediminibacterales bacterium]|nr:flagellar hook-associated protein 1 [Thermosediminibacterales bacterium]
MRSAFFGLEIAKKALFANQYALNVTSHNIANANTEGYSRQNAVMSSLYLESQYGFNKSYYKGQVGSGVTIDEVRQIRDVFVDYDYRRENQALGEWETKSEFLQKIELIFNEPSETGIRNVLDQFWNSLQELSKNPESLTVRETVYQRGIDLKETLNHINKQLSDTISHANFTISTKISDINSIAKQIAQLNLKIQQVEITGDNANDLRDKRNLLIDRLSKIVNIDVTENKQGQTTITISGSSLVQGIYYREIEFDGVKNITWADSGKEVKIKSGELKGLLDIRDEVIADYKSDLQQLADTIMNEINNIHTSGYDLNGNIGEDFFIAGVGEDDLLEVNPLLKDVKKIAAASTADGVPGDGTNALKMAQLKGSVDDFTKSLVAGLGVQTQEAKRNVENQELLVSHLENRREAASGVSLDEEMSNMVRYQHAYNAAARIITAIDEMIGIVVEKMGIVGR